MSKKWMVDSILAVDEREEMTSRQASIRRHRLSDSNSLT